MLGNFSKKTRPPGIKMNMMIILTTHIHKELRQVPDLLLRINNIKQRTK